MPEPAKDQLAALKQAIADRQYDEAIRGARRLVLESEKHPEARTLLGEALLAAGRNDEARVEMLALVRERPEEPAAHRLLGEAHLRDRQLEPARASLRRAVELDPDDEAARDLLLEADSEVASPMSSTVERWMASTEPPTTEMTMPEYLQEAPALTPSASLRSLLERAQVAQVLDKKKGIIAIPRPGAPAAGVTAKLSAANAPPPPSTDSISLELDVDQDASTGQRARPAPPPPEVTGELSLDELVPAPTAPRPERRSAPPPSPRTGSTSPGAVAAPQDQTNHAKLRPRSAPPPSSAAPTSSSGGVLAAPGLARPPSAPPPPRGRGSVPPPRIAAPAPLPAAVARSLRGPAAAPPSARAPDADDSPTLTATPRAEPMISSPTVITGPHGSSGAAGALISPSSVDNTDITRERGALGRGGVGPAPSATPTPAWSASKATPNAAIPQASPPPKLGSMGGAGSVRSGGGAGAGQVIIAPMAPAVASAAPGRPRVMGAGGSELIPARQPGQAEPPTKPTLRSPGSREATQRVRLTQLTVALVLGGIVTVALVFAVTHWLNARERDEALALASDNGTEADLLRAFAATEGIAATRARLFATATVELGEDRSVPAEEQLASAAAGPETSVARSLLAISRGQATEALLMLEALEASGVTLAEGARARALALDAMGRFPEAQAAASQAWGFRRTGARHACLLARTALLANDTASADATIRAIPDADARPCARLGRAQLALARGDLAAADSEASVVLGALAERATRAEEAWAHHLRGRIALSRGDVATARSELQQAGQLAPPADETLLLRVLEGLVAAGDATRAHELTARLTPAAPNGARRAEVLVAIALERRDFAAAESALRMLPQGPRTELAHGRVYEARGDDTGALLRYAAAATDPSVAVETSLRRARPLSRPGRDVEARQAPQPGARPTPSRPSIAAALAHTALSMEDIALARSALEPAMRAHGTDPRLMAISAVLRARDGEREGALVAARQASVSAPDDAEIRLDLAEVARLVGDRATETQACADALRLEPRRFAAVACTVRVVLEDGDIARATQLLEDARRTGAPEPQLSRLRAELAVAAGHGELAVAMVREFTRAHGNDAALLVALARLQLQAEDGAAADATARRVLGLAPENGEALYVRAYVSYVDGRFSTASELLDRAARTARGASLTARVTALRGMLAFESDRYGSPGPLADQAAAADPHCGVAHLLRALINERDRSAQRTALSAAVAGTDPPAEAVARLATSLGPSPEGCALAERYVRMAPDGYDRRDVESVRADCP